MIDPKTQAGIDRATDHANQTHASWSERARQTLELYLEDINGRVFVCPEVRKYAENNGLETPPSNRAWGGVIMKARRDGLIAHHGHRFADRNGAMNKQWISEWKAAA